MASVCSCLQDGLSGHRPIKGKCKGGEGGGKRETRQKKVYVDDGDLCQGSWTYTPCTKQGVTDKYNERDPFLPLTTKIGLPSLLPLLRYSIPTIVSRQYALDFCNKEKRQFFLGDSENKDHGPLNILPNMLLRTYANFTYLFLLRPRLLQGLVFSSSLSLVPSNSPLPPAFFYLLLLLLTKRLFPFRSCILIIFFFYSYLLLQLNRQ